VNRTMAPAFAARRPRRGVRAARHEWSLSAICQHANLAMPCAAGCRLDPSVPMSWDDMVRSKVPESGVSGPHSLHTAEASTALARAAAHVTTVGRAAALTARGHARHHASNNDFSGMPCDARLRGGRPAAVPRWHARDRGSNPLSSNQAEALSAVDRPELPASGSKSAASCSARPIQSCGAAGRCRCRRLVDPGPPGRRSCATKTGSAGLGKVDHRRAAWQFRALSERLDPRGASPISGSSPGCSGTPELDCSAIPA
jgi:hypothetical protein